ncbi:hypothetical protein A2U01_0099818, partial [Trifolium medium]|nr:hypothetical protein [Trifolium medium]
VVVGFWCNVRALSSL